MEISEACRRTIETWPRFAEELRARIIRLANDGFVVSDIEIALEQRGGVRFVQVFGEDNGNVRWACWWQEVREPAAPPSPKCYVT